MKKGKKKETKKLNGSTGILPRPKCGAWEWPVVGRWLMAALYDMGCVGWKTNIMRSQLQAQKGHDLLCQGYKISPRARLIMERTEGDRAFLFW